MTDATDRAKFIAAIERDPILTSSQWGQNVEPMGSGRNMLTFGFRPNFRSERRQYALPIPLHSHIKPASIRSRHTRKREARLPARLPGGWANPLGFPPIRSSSAAPRSPAVMPEITPLQARVCERSALGPRPKCCLKSFEKW